MVRLGLAGKIWMCIAILGVGFLSTMAMEWANARYLAEQLRQMRSDQLPAVLSCQTALEEFKQSRQLYANAVVFGEVEILEEVDKRIFSAVGTLQKINTVNFNPTWAEEVKELANDIATFHSKARTPHVELVKNPDEVNLEMMKELMTEGDRLEKDLKGLRASSIENYEVLLEKTNARIQSQQVWNLIAFVVFSIFAGCGVFFIVSTKIVTPVRNVVQAARGIAAGNYSQRLDYKFKDEMGDLATAFNQMTAHLEETLDGLREEVKEREKAEQETRLLNVELEDRVNKRTNDLSNANDELKESMDRLKATQNKLVETEKMASLGGLVAGVAHEINTPIGIGVTMTTHLMKETQQLVKWLETGTLKKSNLVKYSETALESADLLKINLERAASLIRSFKQVAVDQTSEEIRIFELNEYLDEVLSSLRPQFKRTSHKFKFNCPNGCMVTTYPGALSQVLTNLVTNSLLHGFEDMENGMISIDFVEEEDRVTCRYRDNGVGIPKDALDKIFDPFFTTKRNVGGSGLGMNIVYNLLTQKMDGEISCKSEVGEGTEFTFFFKKDISTNNQPLT